ncbi:MAG: hypothetical protein HRT81_12855 [Henriciella sp.]|nr:hypothetical protein [Henriciella sp.]
MIDAADIQFYQAIADANGIELYMRYTETDAAPLIDYSVNELAKLRKAGRIDCSKLSARKVYYFGFQLVKFILSPTEETPCLAPTKTENSKSATTGCLNKPEAEFGAAHGTTPELDKRDALACANRILS